MYRHVIIEHGARLYQKNSQLYIEADEKHHIPIEDIATLLLANRQISITTYCLETLAEQGTAVILCNGSHLPAGMLLPYATNSRWLKMIRLQISQTRPHLKQLWKQIVQEKIRNQGRCLVNCGKKDTVTHLVDRVKSGGFMNVESTAASLYFRTLFGDNFTRHQDDLLNDILNYGYTIIRSAIARYIAIYGFEPSLGIFHHSELNTFNLADDLLEPFRPVVDMYASRFVGVKIKEMVPAVRHELVQLLSFNIQSGNEVHAVNYAIERTVQSLVRCYKGKESTLLLPELMPLQIHSYE